MAEEETTEGLEEESQEGETTETPSSADPSSDTAGEDQGLDDEAEPETEEADLKPATRADLYRRVSQVEDALLSLPDQLAARLGGTVQQQPQGQAPQMTGRPAQAESNPIQDRLRLQQDPGGFIEDKLKQMMGGMTGDVVQQVNEQATLERIQRETVEEYPELADRHSPFFGAVDKVFSAMKVEGPEKIRLAAREAARQFPDLREKKLVARRKDKSENGTRAKIASTTVETSAPPAKPAKSDVNLTDLDKDIAKKWGMDLSKRKESIRKHKKTVKDRSWSSREKV